MVSTPIEVASGSFRGARRGVQHADWFTDGSNSRPIVTRHAQVCQEAAATAEQSSAAAIAVEKEMPRAAKGQGIRTAEVRLSSATSEIPVTS